MKLGATKPHAIEEEHDVEGNENETSQKETTNWMSRFRRMCLLFCCPVVSGLGGFFFFFGKMAFVSS